MPEKQIFKLSIAADDAVTELQTEPDDPTAEIPIAKCIFDSGIAFTPEAYPELLEEATWVIANDWKVDYPDRYEEGENGWSPIANGDSVVNATISEEAIDITNMMWM